MMLLLTLVTAWTARVDPLACMAPPMPAPLIAIIGGDPLFVRGPADAGENESEIAGGGERNALVMLPPPLTLLPLLTAMLRLTDANAEEDGRATVAPPPALLRNGASSVRSNSRPLLAAL